MKLDFSALAQPAAKARGRPGTTGTPASTRVYASPLAKPGAGTSGDKPAAVALAADLVVAVPAACPPMSPACPQLIDAEQLNGGAVSPASPLVPAEVEQDAAVAPLEREDAAGKPTAAGINTCVSPQELLREVDRLLRGGLIDADDAAEAHASIAMNCRNPGYLAEWATLLRWCAQARPGPSGAN